MEENEAVEQALAELNRFICNHRMRHTLERETIVRTIYSMEDRMSIEDILRQHKKLYPQMHICRSTVYNCVRLLLELNIIYEMKEMNNTVYCKVYGNTELVELICNRCHQARLVSMQHISPLISSLGGADFQMHSFRLTLHGICAMCKLQELKS